MTSLSTRVLVSIGNHGTDQTLLEDVLRKLKSKEAEVQLIQEVLSGFSQSADDLPKDCPVPNAIYIGRCKHVVESICLTEKKDHKPCELTQLALAIYNGKNLAT